MPRGEELIPLPLLREGEALDHLYRIGCFLKNHIAALTIITLNLPSVQAILVQL